MVDVITDGGWKIDRMPFRGRWRSMATVFSLGGDRLPWAGLAGFVKLWEALVVCGGTLPFLGRLIVVSLPLVARHS